MRPRILGPVLAAALVVAALAGCSDDSNDVATDDGRGTVHARYAFDGPGGDPLTQAVQARLAELGFDDVTLSVGFEADGSGVLDVRFPVRSDDGELEVAAFDALDRQGILRFRPVLSTTQGEGPTTPRELDAANQSVDLLELEGDTVVATHHLGPAGLDGAIVEDAEAQLDGPGRWQVHVTITAAAIGGFNALATECFGQTEVCPLGLLAVVVDSQVLSVPLISQPSYARDQIVITKGEPPFTEREAFVLAAALRSGPLPYPLTRITAAP